MVKKRIWIIGIFILFTLASAKGQNLPNILHKNSNHYLPDFSYAGYHFGEQEPKSNNGMVLNALDYNVIPNDGIDDSNALRVLMKKALEINGAVTIQLPKGRIILSDILYIERSNIILRGTGSGQNGTEIYCPRPMRLFPPPESLKELREYLVQLEKLQVEDENNINLPFSQYSWSGGLIWIRKSGTRVKEYLEAYDTPPEIHAEIKSGMRGYKTLQIENAKNLKVGDLVQIEWYNKDGENGSIIKVLYGENLTLGSHHWKYPNHALVRQRALITEIRGNSITIKDPLLLDIRKEWTPKIVRWEHLEEVGLEHFKITFPDSPAIAHHVEEGYNGIYLTRLFNGWVNDVKIENSDSGILTEEVSNITISNIVTYGKKLAHYSVSMSGVHNVLVRNLTVKNKVRHPLSFNTYSTKSVYLNCKIEQEPILDQHSGANHQNLFDKIEVMVSLNGKEEYPLFEGGGAGYWKPAHGAYTTFWNIKVNFEDNFDENNMIKLNGMKDGFKARLIGVHANKPVQITYAQEAYFENINEELVEIPSLFEYQLKKRLN